MTIEAVSFDDEEKELLRNVLGCATGKEAWQNIQTAAVKTRIKKHYIQQQSFHCCYCAKEMRTLHGRIWDVDHILPLATHPQFVFEPRNLAASCVDCNIAKDSKNVLARRIGEKYPSAADAFAVVHPHFDDYSDHIIAGEYVYVALSKKGAFTITLCNLPRYAEEKFGLDSGVLDRRFVGAIEAVMTAKSKSDAAPIIAMLRAVLDTLPD